jgi:hypothetical protein
MDAWTTERTLTRERIFTSGDLPCLSLPDSDGLVTCRWFAEPVTVRTVDAGADPADAQRPAQVGFVLIDPSWLVREGMDRIRTRAVDAVVLHSRTSPPGRTALALAFSSHLRQLQHRMGLESDVVTAGTRPELGGSAEVFRVPHLVTISDGTGTVADTIVWQVMNGARYDAWLGGATRPDHTAIEAALPGLLRLRRLHRQGRLDRSRAGALADLLDGDEMSAQKVFRYPRVVLPAATRATRGGFA